MTVAPELGTGATLTFVTSGYSANLISTTLPSFSRPVIDVTHLGTTGGRDTKAGDLYEVGTATAVFQVDHDDPPPYTAVDEVIRWTLPQSTGETTPSKEEGTGRVTNVEYGEITVDGLMTVTLTMSFTGDWTQTDST